MAITRFTRQYKFLSNFYPSKITLDGIEYRTVEHAYQAAKTFDHLERKKICAVQFPGHAKRLGQKVTIRKDWELVKVETMLELLRQKFLDKNLSRQLCNTDSQKLIEGNNWGDQFWGQCPLGYGSNYLGKLLMRIREELLLSHHGADTY